MKMTKKKSAIFGLAATTLFSVAGFSGCVYGPPVEPSQQEIDVRNNETPDVYGPPEMFNVEDNEPVGVYGPPEMFNVEDNETPDVYGPPVDISEPSDDDGPGHNDKPSSKRDGSMPPQDNAIEPVYGPPADEE